VDCGFPIRARCGANTSFLGRKPRLRINVGLLDDSGTKPGRRFQTGGENLLRRISEAKGGYEIAASVPQHPQYLGSWFIFSVVSGQDGSVILSASRLMIARRVLSPSSCACFAVYPSPFSGVSDAPLLVKLVGQKRRQGRCITRCDESSFSSRIQSSSSRSR
jgi:hypothetical protein